jgi:hypothetical protein
MPTSTAFQATYLEPSVSGGNIVAPVIGSPHRYKVAGALFVLQQRLREGMSGANAQAYVAANRPAGDYAKPVRQAASDLANPTILSDFQAIDAV